METTRITARVNSETQELLKKASAISGVKSINAFIVNAAIEKAKEIIKEENTLKLTQKDTLLFLEAISTSAKNTKLEKAFEKYTL